MADFQRRHDSMAKRLLQGLDGVSRVKERLVNEREGILLTSRDHHRIGNTGE